MRAQVLAERKADGAVIGGAHVRDVLGIPASGATQFQLDPTLADDFRVYVQSQSHNRKLVPGTRVLYQVVADTATSAAVALPNATATPSAATAAPATAAPGTWILDALFAATPAEGRLAATAPAAAASAASFVYGYSDHALNSVVARFFSPPFAADTHYDGGTEVRLTTWCRAASGGRDIALLFNLVETSDRWFHAPVYVVTTANTDAVSVPGGAAPTPVTVVARAAAPFTIHRGAHLCLEVRGLVQPRAGTLVVHTGGATPSQLQLSGGENRHKR